MFRTQHSKARPASQSQPRRTGERLGIGGSEGWRDAHHSDLEEAGEGVPGNRPWERMCCEPACVLGEILLADRAGARRGPLACRVSTWDAADEPNSFNPLVVGGLLGCRLPPGFYAPPRPSHPIPIPIRIPILNEFPGLFLSKQPFPAAWISPVSTFCFPDVGNSRKINTPMTKRFLQLEPGEALKIEATS